MSETPATREWLPEMGEISGFGGSYEAGCRAMLFAALEWLDAHPDADPQFHGYRNVFGLVVEDNEDAEALRDAILGAAFIDPDTGKHASVREYGATGAMMQATVSHSLFIRRNGWDAYVAEMCGRDESDTDSEA